MPRRRPSIASLIDALIAEGREDAVPKGWLSLREIARRSGMNLKTLEASLIWGRYKGCPRKMLKVKADDGRLRKVMHFDTTWKPKA